MKILFILVCFFSSYAFAANTQPSELDAVFRDPQTQVRAPASAVPEDLAKDFLVTAPERQPAAVKKNPPRASAKATKSAHAAKAGKTSQRRSRLPATVANGIELRVQYNKLTSMFWVVERGTHHDLVYANSSGSKSSLGLSAEDFSSVHGVAKTFKPVEMDLSKCKDASMQLHVVANGQAERTVTMCVSSKGADADKLRAFSQSLAALVR